MSLKSKLKMAKGAAGVVRGLAEPDLDADPVRQFNRWFEQAVRSGLPLPEAMAVATATPQGAPSARMMLLKGADARGFVFYTNYQSRKGGELEQNKRVALVFHWAELERQVRVEGEVFPVSAEESDAYFRSRPRGSQVGAWASRQSAELKNRAELEERVRACEARFAGKEIPRPPHWGGFCVRPARIEFWQGRLNRLHDRLCYLREGEGWRVVRLSP